ncbi:MAG: sialate O-acetylesterase [Bacteroidota bacterium]|nr:sialate O-acetylesterase [Bacteroidota bacterium]
MKKLSTILLIALLAVLAVVTTQGASLKLPAILGDHMVLQQNSFTNIWGWAEPQLGIKVTTSWNQKTYRVVADSEGNWKAKVSTGKAGGPYTVTIEADETRVLEDILLGEVWICSGQSNMEWQLRRAETAEEEIPNSEFPHIRLFTVEKHIAIRPNEDVSGSWSQCNPETSAGFSAVGYFFGKMLHQELGVPVGLVNTSWGGTPSESWTSRETLSTFGDFEQQLEELYGTSDEEMEKTREEQTRIETMIKEQQDFENPDNIGFSEGWMKVDFDDADWGEVACPAEWSSLEDIGMLEGVVWMRTEIKIPDTWIGSALSLDLGPVDEMDITYINGAEVGSSRIINNWNVPRNYQIPASLVTSGELQLAIRIVNTNAEGGIFGHPEQLKVYPTENDTETPVPLAGSWKYKIAYKFPEVPMVFNSHTPSVLYNGMLHPLKNMTIKGAIWYQGESNQTRAVQYRTIFPGMIEDWRVTWKQGAFPFYYVQIAPYKYGPAHNSAELREAQFLTLSKVKHTGMAVTMDIGNPDDIHPTNKRDVGKRLALWALAKDYGKDLVFSGPLYREQAIEGNRIRLHFNCTGSGLVAVGGPLTHFEIAGEDQIYHPAEAVIEGVTILVSSPEVESPLAVRYGWSNTAEPNLSNVEGLPASSFCTDNWERITEGRK